jgi:predicted Ser/Thr protein kinase
MSESTADRNPFERIAEEFAERLRKGEHPSLTEYVERFPDHADEMRELFPALALVEQVKPARQERAAPLSGSVRTTGEYPQQLGDYRILRYLGEGGMGVVYEAVRESLRSHVALKVMHPQFRNRKNYLHRFHTEARSAARLHHTNIVSVFDYGEQNSVCYYAMQYIAGQSLDKVLDDVRKLRAERAGPAAAATATLPVGSHDRSGTGEVEVPPTDPPATASLRQSIALGLLTGGFATVRPDLDADEHDPSSTATSSLSPDTQQLEVGTATHGAVSELRRVYAGMTRSHDPARGPTSAEPDEKGVPLDSTSSLSGKTDDRYYREVARLGAQVADALAYAHKRGVLHRDIKPPNLILDQLGNVWVTDFGLAKFQEGGDLSQSQDLIGTLRFMAPERFQGSQTHGATFMRWEPPCTSSRPCARRSRGKTSLT